MALHDITTQEYTASVAPSDLFGREQWVSRRFIGSELKTLKDGTTPSNGDGFKIFKNFKKHFVIDKVELTVTDADTTAIDLDIGYTDGTNTSGTAFETDGDLQNSGVAQVCDDIVMFDDNGYFITMTPDLVESLEDDTEFVVSVRGHSLAHVGITEALTAPI